jgi:hypothetical protein
MSVVLDREAEPLFDLRAATDSDNDFLLGLFAATRVGGLNGRQLPSDFCDHLLRLQFGQKGKATLHVFPPLFPRSLSSREYLPDFGGSPSLTRNTAFWISRSPRTSAIEKSALFWSRGF